MQRVTGSPAPGDRRQDRPWPSTPWRFQGARGGFSPLSAACQRPLPVSVLGVLGGRVCVPHPGSAARAPCCWEGIIPSHPGSPTPAGSSWATGPLRASLWVQPAAPQRGGRLLPGGPSSRGSGPADPGELRLLHRVAPRWSRPPPGRAGPRGRVLSLQTGHRGTAHQPPRTCTDWLGAVSSAVRPPQTSSSHPLPGGACVRLGLTAGISAWSPAGRPGSVSLDCDVVWARTQELPLTESRSLPGSLQV